MFNISSTKTTRNFQAILTPISIVFVLAILLMVGLNIAYKKVSSMYNELKASEKQIASLQSKLDSLSEIKAASLDESNRSVIALPETNPGLFMLSQLSALAEKNSVQILNKGVDKVSDFKENIKEAKLNVSVQADNIESIIGLIKDTQTVSPLSTVKKVEIKEGTKGASADMELTVYWSPFPEKIPAVTQNIAKLSSDDQAILSKILGLGVPSFTVLNPSTPIERENPFE